MKDLKSLKGRTELSVPLDFLTTVTINTFRPQFYFSKEQTVDIAAEVHRRYKDTPEYIDYVMQTLPIMLSSHKVLSAINLFDQQQPLEIVTDVLSGARPDHYPNFWLSIAQYARELGLNRTGLGRRGRNYVWKFLKHMAEERGLRTIALWFTKNRQDWNNVAYKTHAKFKGDLEHLAAGLLFKRKGHLDQIQDPKAWEFFEDLDQLTNKLNKGELTLSDIRNSNLPFLTLEGLASSVMDTRSKAFYQATFDRMTHFEVLRRTDSMRRNGFLDDEHDRWLKRMEAAGKFIDPADFGSVMLQHPDLAEDLRGPLTTSLQNTQIEFPKQTVMLCDASQSMKLQKTNAMPRVIWELAGLVAASQDVPTYFVSNTPQKVEPPKTLRGIARLFGTQKAENPTSLSRGLEKAKEHDPNWVILITDGQSNIPYRGHEKIVAEDLDAILLTLNPTVNPLEPDAATRIGSKNEIFLPLRGLRFMGQLLKVITQ